MKESYKRFWPYIRKYKLQFLMVFIGIILTVSATAATAHIMKPLMDNMFIKKEARMLYIIPMLLIGIYVIKAAGRYIQSVFNTYIGLHIVSTIREEMLAKMVNMDMQFLYMNRSGELISRITNDINRIQYFVSSMMPELIRESLTVVSLVGYIIYLNPTLAFWALIVMPAVIVPLLQITKRLKRLAHRSQEKNADMVTRLTEVFNNSEIIKSNATEHYELKRFQSENEHFFKLNMKSSYTSELISPMMEIIAAVGLAAVIFIGGKQVYSGAMTVGEFTAFLTALGLVFQPLKGASNILGRVQDAQAASERVFHIFDIQNQITDGQLALKDAVKRIQFDQVTLKFEDKTALDAISIDIKAGETIALVGQSGGGKSSFVNLLLRFYDPISGTISINGHNLKEYTQQSLRSQIAFVSQRVYIFQDTLAANVAYGDTIDEARVKEALAMADALEFAQSLPDGIYTVMQEFGANLSGGQRQRIAIARAIYKHASLLILDEATSALDNETERKIQNTLKDYTKDKITILIAHRLSTVQDADRILVFKAGKIVAEGSHQDLLNSSEEYQRLSQTLTES
ncbi:ABC transporter transmembrane domain-containing protein [Sulfuricurvum sp.]|uniref:ABC transporter ATP-binding protein n=1 Tax=Sulfuricurvum sp. TaxID=2025608 RepID=UPI00261E333D|nr:ABC transporter transmembrane domain-containing protein [Sulfuricurvum sp.]MDD2267410.1 ABC transporter transmembrane domain-containing protein [Sulfuricurvum sp.]MDD2784199.1 ABC transporter transmembrane domain-containing protein [Sulfuricurvum sp.]